MISFTWPTVSVKVQQLYTLIFNLLRFSKQSIDLQSIPAKLNNLAAKQIQAKHF